MADINLLFKTAVKEIAHAPGRAATFMAKPHADDAGYSCHIHSSLWSADGATSLMADATATHHMSDVFRWYLGGLLATAREFALLFAPNVNSYKRFQPGSWAPTADRLGRRQPHARVPRRRPRRRGCASRAASPAPTSTATTRSRRRSPAASTASSERIEPPPPYRGNGYTAADLPRIPTTFAEAIELLARQRGRPGRASATTSTTTSCTTPSTSGQAFNRAVTDWERARYFERI